MCTGVQFSDGQRADTVGELRGIVGDAFVTFRAGYSVADMRPRECLCSVDVVATARRVGAVVDQFADPFDLVWTWPQRKERKA